MKTTFRKSTLLAIALLTLTSAAALADDLTPRLSIHPLAVQLPTEDNQYFLATFSDRSPISSCTWKVSGEPMLGNGIRLTTTDRNWAVFYDGTQAGVNYTISASCRSENGILGSASAYVFVR